VYGLVGLLRPLIRHGVFVVQFAVLIVDIQKPSFAVAVASL
jgi:hypothetical protein